MIDQLRRLPLFERLTTAELGLIAPHLRTHRLAAGAVLFTEGEVASGCYVVLDGEVEVLKNTGNFQESLAVLGRGALAGHFSLVDGRPRSATCRAGVTGAQLVELGREEFDLLFRARSPFAYKILDRIALDLAARLRAANERLEDAHRARTVEERRAAARAAGRSLFEVPSRVHGVDLDAIEVSSADPRPMRRPPPS